VPLEEAVEPEELPWLELLQPTTERTTQEAINPNHNERTATRFEPMARPPSRNARLGMANSFTVARVGATQEGFVITRALPAFA
jgi:hypothetical protein